MTHLKTTTFMLVWSVLVGRVSSLLHVGMNFNTSYCYFGLQLHKSHISIGELNYDKCDCLS